MARPTVVIPDELLTKIDQQRAREAAESGDVQSRSEWFREAAREKLGIDYTEDQPNDSAAESKEGAA
jgi:metal-responsive CopG/Arc/MetJ family transcriptional regulator